MWFAAAMMTFESCLIAVLTVDFWACVGVLCALLRRDFIGSRLNLR